jgi:hypothetical protein
MGDKARLPDGTKLETSRLEVVMHSLVEILSQPETFDIGDRVAVVGFGARGIFGKPVMNVAMSLQPIKELSTTRQLPVESLASLKESGVTPMGHALRFAINIFEDNNHSALGRERMIVLVTDGESNSGEKPEDVIPDLSKMRIKVQGIGLGNGADMKMLRRLAQSTGGTASQVLSPRELPSKLVPQKIVVEEVQQQHRANVSGGSRQTIIVDSVTEFKQKLRSGDLDFLQSAVKEIINEKNQLDKALGDHSINPVKYSEFRSILEFKRIEVKEAYMEARSKLRRELVNLQLRRNNTMKESTTYKELDKQVVFLESQIKSIEGLGKDLFT